MSKRHFSSNEISAISRKIRDEFYQGVLSHRSSIFLCGASITDDKSLRSLFAKHIKERERFTDIIYPEDVFEELLYGPNRNDILTLELLLANSVDAIVIVPESPGAFTELGAFTHDPLLREKIICITEAKYKNHKSFINQGPIKLIKQFDTERVIYVEKSDESVLGVQFGKVHKKVTAIKKQSPVTKDKISLLQLENFILPAVYLLEPLSSELLVSLVEIVSSDPGNAKLATITAINIMTRKRLLFKNLNGGYQLTATGLQNFYLLKTSISRRSTHADKRSALDDFRLDLLNWKLRHKALNLQ